MKGNKGITLIALVITIIVLLILAAVSIAMLSGDNSILKRAKSSVGYNYVGAAKDEVALAYNAAFANVLAARYDNTIPNNDARRNLSTEFANQINAISNKHSCTISAPDSNGKVTISYTDDQSTKYETTATLNASEGHEALTWTPITVTEAKNNG